jgi:hypothetical protein
MILAYVVVNLFGCSGVASALNAGFTRPMINLDLNSVIGFKALTVGHVHPDVLPGTPVVVTGVLEDGLVVKVTGYWMVAGSDNGRVVHETREIWLAPKNLKLIP